jgi:hypothetical protein
VDGGMFVVSAVLPLAVFQAHARSVE